MRWPTLSVGAWKVLLVLVALVVTGLWLTVNAEVILTRLAAGSPK